MFHVLCPSIPAKKLTRQRMRGKVRKEDKISETREFIQFCNAIMVYQGYEQAQYTQKCFTDFASIPEAIAACHVVQTVIYLYLEGGGRRARKKIIAAGIEHLQNTVDYLPIAFRAEMA